MYKVLLVDDEPLMLRYLESNLKKIDSRWEVCGSAQDGVQAVSLLEQEVFELVITDIRMPEMDGLALARYIQEKSLKTKVILISGYDDFEYARQAVRCGVYDYILKPLVDSELKKALDNIAEKIREESLRDIAVQSLQTLSQKSFEEVKAAFLSALLHENQREINALYPVLHKMQVSLLDGWGAIMILRPNTLMFAKQKMPEENRLLYRIMIRELCGDLDLDKVLFCEDMFGNLAFLITSEYEENIFSRALELKAAIERTRRGKTDIPLAASIGDAVSDLFGLSESYHTALDAFICTDQNSELRRVEHLSQRRYADIIKGICGQIIAALNVRDDTAVLVGIGALLNAFGKPFSLDECALSAFGFVSAAAKGDSVYVNNFESAYYHLARVLTEKAEVTEQDITAAYSVFLRRLRGDGYNTLASNMDISALAEAAKEYICLHYSEPLSLAFLAGKFNVTPAYLSDLFHKNIGESYTKFLARIRMEQSARILRTEPQTKIYSIAEQVGFVSVKHFNAVFKKHYGMSPKDYQRIQI
ncbi:MAG: response regulator [Oscillospiraceae bacterium]|nr:response regulator [Oscillospiraceae bacterium]